ncbi:MAG TPA: metallophosphoesterase [Deinococcales bacterium]|nr:metallophosphoesterase [Deinococcales bacterium]
MNVASADPNRFRHLQGPFDLIGDVHGCFAELRALLARLGWRWVEGTPRHPDGRRLVLVGDLVDRGPDVPGVLKALLPGLNSGELLAVPGNHDDKYARYLSGSRVTIANGLEDTIAQVDRLDTRERRMLQHAFRRWFEEASWHLLLDEGRLVVAHAGLTPELFGRSGRQVRSRALYGEVLGYDAGGLPIRRDWARDYRGQPLVVYGHTPALPVQVVNGTVNIDQGCVFGGFLTGLRYPELTFESVPAERAYAGTSEAFVEALAAAGRSGFLKG